jgi:hypothetical protein
MSYVTLTTSCNDSAFTYKVGCGATSDTWTTANSTALAPTCNVNPFTHTITSNCSLNSTSSIATGFADSNGNLLVTEYNEYLILG